MNAELHKLKAYPSELENWEDITPYLEEKGYQLEISDSCAHSVIEVQVGRFTSFILIDESRGMDVQIVTDILDKHGALWRKVGDGSYGSTQLIRVKSEEQEFLCGYFSDKTIDGQQYTMLSKPHLDWIFPPAQRLKFLVHAFDSKVHAAATETLLDMSEAEFFISHYRAAVPRNYKGNISIWLDALRVAIEQNFPALESHINFHAQDKAYTSVNTATHTLHSIMEENKQFIKSLLTVIFRTLNAAEIKRLSWPSVVDVLMTLADGKNGAYLNDASRLKSEMILKREEGGKIALSVDEKYNQERREETMQHNKNVKQLTNLQQEMEVFAADVLFTSDPTRKKQGQCPVKSNGANHDVHVFAWIVQIAEQTHRIYLKYFESENEQ